MLVQRYSQSCFRFEAGGLQVYFDPYKVPDGSPKADIVLVSHPHVDHADMKSLKKLLKEGTIVVAPASAKDIVAMPGAVGLQPGDERDVGGLHVEAVPAYNKKNFFHEKNKGWLGYVVTLGGSKVYHAGDTEHVPEMAGLKKKSLDIACLPIGGLFTMNVQGAVRAVLDIAPRVVIPMHELRASAKKFEEMVKEASPGTRVLVMKIGETLNID